MASQMTFEPAYAYTRPELRAGSRLALMLLCESAIGIPRNKATAPTDYRGIYTADIQESDHLIELIWEHYQKMGWAGSTQLHKHAPRPNSTTTEVEEVSAEEQPEIETEPAEAPVAKNIIEETQALHDFYREVLEIKQDIRKIVVPLILHSLRISHGEAAANDALDTIMGIPPEIRRATPEKKTTAPVPRKKRAPATKKGDPDTVRKKRGRKPRVRSNNPPPVNTVVKITPMANDDYLMELISGEEYIFNAKNVYDEEVMPKNVLKELCALLNIDLTPILSDRGRCAPILIGALEDLKQ